MVGVSQRDGRGLVCKAWRKKKKGIQYDLSFLNVLVLNVCNNCSDDPTTKGKPKGDHTDGVSLIR